MDVMMPEMDGFEATWLIRQQPRWRKLPIIAVTAKAMKDDQHRCLQAGANDGQTDRPGPPVLADPRMAAATGANLTSERDTDIEIRLLIEAIYLKYSYDFRNIPALRSSAGSCALRQFGCRRYRPARARAARPWHVHALLQYLTIPVSEMFRDPGHFLALRNEVVPAAHLAIDQGVDRRLQQGEGVFDGHPAARRRPARAHHHLRHRHQSALAG